MECKRSLNIKVDKWGTPKNIDKTEEKERKGLHQKKKQERNFSE